ncbi:MULTISPECIES: ABC transporter permease [Microtetraspora]|uniref:ABC transporter permease n=1 Tax=Microtetraspora glauca TaxID=1996 RepID=A0ABV3GJN5_MICGL|nr:ABC transporter permease [Microtetraspora sp. AC03309]MCC5579969.1 ABC transporter permease [Microtetraspora sp. AC03309]
MLTLILRQAALRAVVAVPTLIVVTCCTYVMLFSIGDPAAVVAGESATPEQVAQVRQSLGLDRSVVAQYLDWLAHAVRGDFGESLHHRGDVLGLVGQYLPATLLLSFLALAVAVLASVLMGSAVGARPGGLVDRGLGAVAVLGIAVPNFLVGYVLILVFSLWFGWFPSGGYRTPAEAGLLTTFRFLVLPSASLALGLMCVQTRTFRASLIKEYEADYVRTARMKGVSPSGVFFRHVARNASAPWVTVIGLEIGVLITGALLVESVFSIPGIGTLTLEAVQGQDFPVVQALVTLFALVILAVNLVTDLIALWLNPASRGLS